MQNNNSQSRDTRQSSDCMPVRVQDNDMNVSSNAAQPQTSRGPITATSQNSSSCSNIQALQQQQLQILAACNAATACASHQLQTQGSNNGTLVTSNLPSIAPNSSVASAPIPPAFMMNYLMAVSAMGFPSGLGAGMNPSFPLTALASAHKPKPVPHTPGVFLHCSLRSGKWIEEEEKYAALLIELFEKGKIPQCENGSTLRSFLSQKLHCPKMRISKKYAGRGIGKLVYTDKSKVVMTSEEETEHMSLVAKVLEAQEKFHQAALPSQNASTATMNGFGSLSAPSLIPGLPPTPSSNLGTPFTPIQPSLPISAQKSSFIASQVSSDAPKNTSPTAIFTEQKDVSSEEAAKTLLEESAKLLRQSFLAAFYQSDAPNSILNAQNGLEVKSEVPCSTTLESSQPLVAKTNDSQTSSKPGKRIGQSSESLHLAPPFDLSVSSTSLTKQKGEQSIPSALTSRSYNDFPFITGNSHLLAGNVSAIGVYNLSSPDASKRAARSNASSNPLFTAESYAMFAVESAMEASQHDAYLPCSRIYSGTGDDQQCQIVLRSNSIDNIDGVVNLLAKQSTQKQQEVPLEKGELRDSKSHGALSTESSSHGAGSYEGKTSYSTLSMQRDPGYTATYEAMNFKPAYVSASERSCYPSTESESFSALESLRGSTNSENTESSPSDGGSSSESSDCGHSVRRKRDHTEGEPSTKLPIRDAKRTRKEFAMIK
ncbi:hypothetical protein FisN_3Lh172 [Fistulifera solaris]|uniref:Uncharacterized protein n=1 Tax=Fistulifera solaris TaxID=1519565 RepID=A0A1Z5JP09_FISSO|nr:hypothetical protein FisN_3Lh172 [Fistulifera solaris]|eukprot:GAX15734.1 hypothetical protein FisN_3Lh172 [Fistulifera solaris]